MTLRILIPIALFLAGALSAILGAWIVDTQLFWCGAVVAGIGIVLASLEDEETP
jgi:hypothetical protein